MTLKIEKILAERSETYERLTLEATNEIKPIIEGIKEFIMMEELAPPHYELQLTTMGLLSEVKDDANSGALMIRGLAVPPIGDKVPLATGEVYEVTSEMEQQVLGRAVQVLIQTQILKENDKKKTIDYLFEQTAKQKKMLEEAEQKALAEKENIGFEGLGDIPPLDITEKDKNDEDKLMKILEGATNKSGLLN